MFKNVFFYEARVAHGFSTLLPALLLPAYGLIALISWLSSGIPQTAPQQLQAFAYLLPLAAGLSAAHLMTVERDENFDALRRTYPETAWRLPLIRAAGAAAYLAVGVILSASLLRLGNAGYPLDDVVMPVVPAALFMMMLGLFIGNLTGNQPAAVVAVAGWWFMDFQTGGEVTRAMFLFMSVQPLPGIDPDVNVLLLCAAAVGLFLMNVAWSIRRRRAGG